MFDDPEQLREAESLYRAAISQNPGKASLHNSLGSILRALGRLGEAAVEFHEAIRTSPDEAAARTAHQHAIALNPGDAKAYLGHPTPGPRQRPNALRGRPKGHR